MVHRSTSRHPMSGSLRSGLDGPKWAPTNGGKRLRSESRVPVNTAPKKQKIQTPSAESQARFVRSSRRLFISDSDHSHTMSNSLSSDSSSVHNDEETPQASKTIGDSSFLTDFFPKYPHQGLVDSVVGVASAVAGAAKVVTSSLVPNGIPVHQSSHSEQSEQFAIVQSVKGLSYSH